MHVLTREYKTRLERIGANCDQKLIESTTTIDQMLTTTEVESSIFVELAKKSISKTDLCKKLVALDQKLMKLKPHGDIFVHPVLKQRLKEALMGK